jgi:hypothetical protein
MDEHNASSEGPDFEVWNWLESGWQQAYDDMARQSPPRPMAFYEAVADGVFNLKTSLFIAPGSEPISSAFASEFPQFSRADEIEILSSIAANYPNLNVWIKHAIELEVASRGIARATIALERFESLLVEILRRPIPDKALPYVRELVHTYLFGFDAAAIALARSTFEQLGKVVLTAKGIYSEPQLRRERPTAGTILERLKQAGCVSSAYSSASRLVGRGDVLLHRGMYEDKVLGTLALDSIRELVEVVRELGPDL